MNRHKLSGRGARHPGGKFRGKNRARASFPKEKEKFERAMEPSSEDEEEEDEDNYHRNKGKGGRKCYVMKYPKDFEEQESSSEESEEEEGYGNQAEVEESVDYSQMPMEDLLQLQEEIGTKAFNKQILKANPQSKGKVEEKQQESPVKRRKKEPLAMPLMRKTAYRMNSLDPKQKKKKEIIRDPRFDNLSGNLDLSTWREHYQFLDELRKEEKKVLEKDLEGQNDDETKEKIKSILKRMENQEKQRAFREAEEKVKMEIKSQQKDQLREGIKPQFLSKKEMHMKVKAKHFETLKKEKRLDKYMERQEKRLHNKERKNKRTV